MRAPLWPFSGSSIPKSIGVALSLPVYASLQRLANRGDTGAISSSGVTKAIYDYWEYYAPIIEFGPQDCITTIQRLVSIVDNIILVEKNATLTNQLKAAYQLEGLK